MTGLLFFALFTGWLYVAIRVSVRLSRQLPQSKWRPAVVPLSIAVLMVAPVADEIVIALQFQRMCRENDHVVIGNIVESSRTVYLADLPRLETANGWVRVRAIQWRFVDVVTKQTLVSYDTLTAGGGWLSRVLPVASGHAPILFKGFCEPRDADPTRLLTKHGLKEVQRQPQRN